MNTTYIRRISLMNSIYYPVVLFYLFVCILVQPWGRTHNSWMGELARGELQYIRSQRLTRKLSL